MYVVGQTEYSNTGMGGAGNSLDAFLRFRAEGVYERFQGRYLRLQGMRFQRNRVLLSSLSSTFLSFPFFFFRESVPPNCRFVARARKKRSVLFAFNVSSRMPYFI